MAEVRGTIKSMLEKGQDPKDYLIEVCRPQCTALQQKLQRCETALKNMTHADPELSCMYPLRDWVTCVDACVTTHSPRSNQKYTRNSSATNSASSRDHHSIPQHTTITHHTLSLSLSVDRAGSLRFVDYIKFETDGGVKGAEASD